MYGYDPLDDYHLHDSMSESELSRLPRCPECDEPIIDETAYYINGEWLCRECLKNYEREVVPE